MSGATYDSTIAQAAQSWGVDPNLLRAVVQDESGAKG
jgi:soluble lytic murein transglycosylase-like protein